MKKADKKTDAAMGTSTAVFHMPHIPRGQQQTGTRNYTHTFRRRATIHNQFRASVGLSDNFGFLLRKKCLLLYSCQNTSVDTMSKEFSPSDGSNLSPLLFQ